MKVGKVRKERMGEVPQTWFSDCSLISNVLFVLFQF